MTKTLTDAQGFDLHISQYEAEIAQGLTDPSEEWKDAFQANWLLEKFGVPCAQDRERLITYGIRNYGAKAIAEWWPSWTAPQGESSGSTMADIPKDRERPVRGMLRAKYAKHRINRCGEVRVYGVLPNKDRLGWFLLGRFDDVERALWADWERRKTEARARLEAFLGVNLDDVSNESHN